MKVTSVKPLPDYRLWLRFADETEGTVDLSEKVGRVVFVSWKDPKAFAEVRVGDFGQLIWPGHIDLCADGLCRTVTRIYPLNLQRRETPPTPEFEDFKVGFRTYK
jgi:Protein of unknown function (DUF2442)